MPTIAWDASLLAVLLLLISACGKGGSASGSASAAAVELVRSDNDVLRHAHVKLPLDTTRRGDLSESALSTLGRQVLQAGTEAEDEADVCEFFKSGYGSETDELHWGRHDLCNLTIGAKWAQRAAARCQDCVSRRNICTAPPRLLIHQYLTHLDTDNWRGNLASIQAYLLTQDLRKTHLVMWADEVGKVVTRDTRNFFHTFRSAVSVRAFDYDIQVAETPLAKDPFFSNASAVRAALGPAHGAAFSDLVRYVLLFNHGGLWVDNDVLLLRDVYPITTHVGYQFMMRWPNAHVLYLTKRSAVAARILRMVALLPLPHPAFHDIVEGLCRLNGYYEVTDKAGMHTDVWAFCALRLALRQNNTSNDPGEVLFDVPLGWWDADWPGTHAAPGCPRNDAPVSADYFEDYVGDAFGMHTRYPGHDGHTPVPGSPLGRTLAVLEQVFESCASLECLPRGAVPLVAYVKAGAFRGPDTPAPAPHGSRRHHWLLRISGLDKAGPRRLLVWPWTI